MAIDRRKGRILAVQALCQWDVQGGTCAAALEAVRQLPETQQGGTRYAAELLDGFEAKRTPIDQQLAEVSEKWDLSRIAPVERNVMRVAVVEFMESSVPPKVSINEAIEIAREYGGAESSKFVNGLLDSVLKRLEQQREGDT